MVTVWTSANPESVHRYESLPSGLQLREHLRLVNPTPTGWVPVLRDSAIDHVHSTLTCVLVAPESIASVLEDAGWSTRGLGAASANPGRGFSDGLGSLDDGYEAMFFAHSRRHHGLVAPSIEFTPSFCWLMSRHSFPAIHLRETLCPKCL